MKIHCLTHVPFEDAANIQVWADYWDHKLSYTHLYKNESLPDLDDFDMLVIMGGSMNVHEEHLYYWLKDEKKFIQKAIASNKKVLGICLGAQLIANVLGGEVYANSHKEIGWHPVKLSSQAHHSSLFAGLPEEMEVFHWHGDTFSLPPKATPLASSEICANQAFEYQNNVLGLQFHIEYSVESIEKMLTHCGDEIVEAPYIQSEKAIRAGCDKIHNATNFLHQILDKLIRQ